MSSNDLSINSAKVENFMTTAARRELVSHVLAQQGPSVVVIRALVASGPLIDSQIS